MVTKEIQRASRKIDLSDFILSIHKADAITVSARR